MKTVPPPGVHITYQCQRRRCGRVGCGTCKEGGAGHGPYWYGFYRLGKKLKSFYVGKEPPERAEVTMEVKKR